MEFLMHEKDIFLQNVQHSDWKKGIISWLREIHPEDAKINILRLTGQKNFANTAWRFFTGRTENINMLQIGGGFDLIPLRLSENVNHITITGIPPALIVLYQKIFTEEKIKNATIYESHSFQLAGFADKTFDLVYLHHSANLLQGQFEKFFQRIAQILKTDGHFIIGFNNSWNPERFAALKDLFKSGKEKQNSNGANFSFAKQFINPAHVRKNLDTTGFIKTTVYAVGPQIDHINHIANPADPNWDFYSKSHSGSLKKKVQNFLQNGRRLYRFSPAFLIVAGKSDSDSWLNKFTHHLQQSLFLSDKPVITKFFLRNGDKALIEAAIITDTGKKRIPAIIKLPLRCSALFEMKQSAETLHRIHENVSIPEKLKKMIPKQIDSGEFKSIPYFIEEEIPSSISLLNYTANESEKQENLIQAAQFIEDFHKATAGFSEKSEDIIRQFIISAMEEVWQYAGLSCDDAVLLKLTAYVQEKLPDSKLPFVYSHGDFGLHNILLDSDSKKMKAVIDWDRSNTSGLPLLDLLHLFVFQVGKKQPLQPEMLIEKVFEKNFTIQEEQLLASYSKELNLNAEWYNLLSIAYWLSWILPFKHSGSFQNLNFDWVQTAFYRPYEYWMKKLPGN